MVGSWIGDSEVRGKRGWGESVVLWVGNSDVGREYGGILLLMRAFASIIVRLCGLETYDLHTDTGNEVVKRNLLASPKRTCRPFPCHAPG